MGVLQVEANDVTHLKAVLQRPRLSQHLIRAELLEVELDLTIVGHTSLLLGIVGASGWFLVEAG